VPLRAVLRTNRLRIAFYTPFKPLGHPHPSGDLVIATGLYDFLIARGHSLWPVGPLRTRWIYTRPWQWPIVLREYHRAHHRMKKEPVDLWLTYHAYYKAPDVLGPWLSTRHGVPYAIFQGIYSTKRRRQLRTRPGFELNKRALVTAQHVFSNRRMDLDNLRRIIPDQRLSYIRPGIDTGPFRFDAEARKATREQWQVGEQPVILSAAMMRPDVKSRGLDWVIRSCGRLSRQGLSFCLVIAGDGKERNRLEHLAAARLPGRVRFVSKIPRDHMYRFYSAGDLFVFPGIRESLGMVYLESQCCGLPVVAFENGGIPEVVDHGVTGLLTPSFDTSAFDTAVKRLMVDTDLRQKMGRQAAAHVRAHHDLTINYGAVETTLAALARKR
jgi:phosphatidylinositol alpha-1,6-mannosyltransferase